MNKKEAAQKMVNQEFNAIPLTLIEKAYPHIDGFENVTPIKEGDYVIYDGGEAEVINVNEDGSFIEVETVDGEKVDAENFEFEREDVPYFPMWGTVWHAVGFQSDWIGDNLDKVSACGFEIYEAEDVDGYILGVNGAGYDFYEAHWIPLYDAQGLQWHDEKEAE